MDSIDRFVARLSARSHFGLWANGTFPRIDLPKTATLDRVVASVFNSVSFDLGSVGSYSILLTKQVRVGDEPLEYTAILVETNLGRKIILLQHQGQRVGWWSRVYDEDAD